MESFPDAVKLMFFVYVLAAGLSLVIAWIIKTIFVVVQYQKARTGDSGGNSDGGEAQTEGST